MCDARPRRADMARAPRVWQTYLISVPSIW
jgi:hypothetical protein